MSGRSAHARKKFTEGKTTAPASAPAPKSSKSSRSRAVSTAPSEHHDHHQYTEPMSPGFGGYAEFPQPPRAPGTSASRSSGSWGTPSEADPGETTSKTGFRNLIDKRSDNVRKGIVKTFTFRKKDKEEETPVDEKRKSSYEYRPESQATMRHGVPGGHGDSDKYVIYEDYPASPPLPTQYQNPSNYRPPHHPQQFQQYPQYQQPGHPSRPPEAHELGPSPTSRHPPPVQNKGPPIKRWIGGGRTVTRWNKLNRDPELLDPNGDVLVFLCPRDPEQNQDYGSLTMPLPLPPTASRPPASFRISSHVIESTESRYLITQMREGLREDDNEAASPSRSHSIQPPNNMGGHPTPPLSDGDGDSESDISFEMYFPPPPGLSHAEQVRHQLTTRNVFALLYRASLVGFSLHQALTDLHARLDRYYSPGENDAVGQLVNYLSARGITDVRGDAESAVGLLAWTERPGVRWAQGWREAFIHCAGMFGQGLERCADWRFVAPLTKALLERSWLEMRLRVQTAEERLADFGLGEMWPEFGQSAAAAGASPAGGPANGGVGSARGAAERLQKMLMGHYTRTYGSWPPPPSRDRPSRKTGGGNGTGSGSGGSSDEEEMWLTRSVVMALQRDFGALYDYLIDRDVSWDVSEARAGRKWMMVSADESQGFEADAPDMPMTDILIEFDNKLRLPHMPHPHPLLPASIPPMPAPGNMSGGGGGMFKSSSQPAPPPKNLGRERRVALAYTESSNLDALGSTFAHSPLVDAFTRFEKSDRVGEVDPATARRGRWTVLYAVLQTLASVSVDAPGMRFHEGVSYHLSARVRRPAWSKAAELFGDASHEMSHCWMAPKLWAEAEAEAEAAAELATSRMDEYGGGLPGQLMDDETAAWEEESLPALPRSPPQLSASASETGSSVRTASTHSGVYSHNLRRQAMMGASPTLPASPMAAEQMMTTPLPPLPAGAAIQRRRVGAGPPGGDRDRMADYHSTAPRTPLPMPPTQGGARMSDRRNFQAIEDVTEGVTEVTIGYRRSQPQKGPRVMARATTESDDEYRDDMKMLRRRIDSPVIRDFDRDP